MPRAAAPPQPTLLLSLLRSPLLSLLRSLLLSLLRSLLLSPLPSPLSLLPKLPPLQSKPPP